MENSKQRFRAKLLHKKPSVYVEYPLRCVYTLEFMKSVNAPVEVQILELEAMLADD